MTSSPLKVGIIGGGPSGYFVAKRLLNKIKDISVHIFDKNKHPYGLLRYGVAPDHPELKQLSLSFDSFLKNNKKISVFQNINIQNDKSPFSLNEIRKKYDVVVLCTGAQENIELDLNHKKIEKVVPANKIVDWYNKKTKKNSLSLINNGKIVLIGNGNVALDIARLLLKPPEEIPNISPEMVSTLKKINLKEVKIIGRRGPENTSFGLKELKEFLNLKDVRFVFNKEEIRKSLEKNKENKKILLFNKKIEDEDKNSFQKKCSFDFFSKITKIVPKNGYSELFKKNVFSNKTEKIKCSLIVTCLGYKTDPLGFPVVDGHFFHDGKGRIIGQENLYASGWCKTGAKGSISHTMADSFETANTIIKDKIKKTSSLVNQ